MTGGDHPDNTQTDCVWLFYTAFSTSGLSTSPIYSKGGSCQMLSLSLIIVMECVDNHNLNRKMGSTQVFKKTAFSSFFLDFDQVIFGYLVFKHTLHLYLLYMNDNKQNVKQQLLWVAAQCAYLRLFKTEVFFYIIIITTYFYYLFTDDVQESCYWKIICLLLMF